MSTRNISAPGGGAAAQILSAGEAAALRHPEVLAAFWPRAVKGTKRIAASRVESVDLIDPTRTWRTVATAAPIVTINKTLADDTWLYRIGNGAVGDMKLYRDDGVEVEHRVNPKRTGGFSVVQALYYTESSFSRSVSVMSATRDIYMGPRGFVNNRIYVGYDAIASTTTANFLLQGAQALPDGMHVIWWSCDWEDGRLYSGADTSDPFGTRAVNKTVTPATDLPSTIDKLLVAHRNSGRIDDCYIGPTVFIAAPIHRLEHKVLRESIIAAVAGAVGVTITTALPPVASPAPPDQEVYTLLEDASTDGSAVDIVGGSFTWTSGGTFGSATATLQMRASASFSWEDIPGCVMTDADHESITAIEIATGQVRVTVSGADSPTLIDSVLSRIN